MNQTVAGAGPDTGVNVRRYVLTVLVVVYTFNFIDRQILSILLESIKLELGLSDQALGFLAGFAFAAFYAVLGIPIALWADRGNRRNLITVALALWSVMTALSGVAQNFVHLLLARIGVGIGEAGCSPPAHSLISDYYPPKERATALGLDGVSLSLRRMCWRKRPTVGWLEALFSALWRLDEEVLTLFSPTVQEVVHSDSVRHQSC